MTYRDDAPSLRAECVRLRAEVARLRARPARVPMRLVVRPPESLGAFVAGVLATALGMIGALLVLVRFIVDGVVYSGTPREARTVIVAGVLALVWALAFVRRVPAAEGARS